MLASQTLRHYLRASSLIAATAIAAIPATVIAHGTEHHAADSSRTPGADSAAALQQIAVPAVMGIDEKLGNFVPLDLPFVTHTGDSILLREAVNGPTILCILYYKCTNACNILLTSIAEVLSTYANRQSAAPSVITITVDETETPTDAARAHAIAYQALQGKHPPDRWKFLTGPFTSIRAVTDAVGFQFVKRGDDYDHPLGIIILSPKGEVTRYIMGTEYLPVDITMSLMEASKGSIQPTIARVLRSCFSYDQKSHRYVFSVLRVSATVIFLLMGSFITYLVISGRKRRKGRGA